MAGLLKLTVKCGIAGAIVYGISSLNVFSSQDKAITSLKELQKSANTYLPPVDLPVEIPSSLNSRQKWNSGVQAVFSYIEVVPDKVIDTSITGYEKTKDYVTQQLKK